MKSFLVPNLLPGNLRFIDKRSLQKIFEMLGFDVIECKVVLATASRPVRESDIVRLTREPRTKVRRAIFSLETRAILRKVEALGLNAPSTQHWQSDLRGAISRLKILAS